MFSIKTIILSYLGRKSSLEVNKSKGRKGKIPWNKGLKLSEETKLKISKATSGKNNPMYGKPSPQGSGNGWSGWYKGWFFRSLMELSFMINVIERFNFKWESAENKKYKIEYKDWNNNERTYYADFILNEKYMIEIKPMKLHNSKSIILKKNAAIDFCKKNNLKYKLIDPIKILSKKDLINMIEIKDLKFLEKYKEKFNNYDSK